MVSSWVGFGHWSWKASFAIEIGSFETGRGAKNRVLGAGIARRWPVLAYDTEFIDKFKLILYGSGLPSIQEPCP